MRKFVLLFCLSLGAFRASLHASAFDLIGVGARARSMGEAFVALSDDYSTIYWNPAGLTGLKKRELGFSYEDRFSLGLVGTSHVALTYPEIGPGGIGISWTRLAASVTGLDYSENTYTFAYGMEIRKIISFGTSLNFYRLSSSLNASGYGLNTSMKIQAHEKLLIGALWQNMASTSLQYEGGAEDPLPRDLRAGLAVLPVDRVKATFDVDHTLVQKPTIHAGMELEFIKDQLALRGGVSQKAGPGTNWVYSVGGTAGYGGMAVDYSFENHFDLGLTHLFSVKVVF